MAGLLPHNFVNVPFADETPHTDSNAGHAGQECEVVCAAVAGQSIRALTVAVRADNGVTIVHRAIEKIKDISAEDGCQGHDSPVLGKTPNPKCMGGQGRENTEQETVRNACQSGDKDKRIRVRDGGAAELS